MIIWWIRLENIYACRVMHCSILHGNIYSSAKCDSLVIQEIILVSFSTIKNKKEINQERKCQISPDIDQVHMWHRGSLEWYTKWIKPWLNVYYWEEPQYLRVMALGKSFHLSGSENWRKFHLACEQMLTEYSESIHLQTVPLNRHANSPGLSET